MKLKSLLTAVLLASCALGARGAVVTLKDGSSLRGKVTGQTMDGVELETPDGTLHVGVERILRIDYAAPTPPPAGVEAPPPVAISAPREGRQFVSFGFGMIEPVGRVDFHSIGGGSADNGDLGAQFSAQHLCLLSPRLGVGLDVDYFARGGTISERLSPSASASVRGESWVMLGILRYSFTDRGRARPFVLAGAGGAYNSETIDVRPSGLWADTNTHETRRLIDDSAWIPAASARLGVDVSVDAIEPGTLTFEAGWTGLAAARYGATPQGQKLGLSGISAPVNIISFTARYGWRF